MTVKICEYFVKRKKRFCKMTCKENNKYCPEHSIVNDDSAELKRIICPIDNKHTVYEHKLKKHLVHCNANQSTKLGYYSANLNILVSNNGAFKEKLSEIEDIEIKQFIERIINIKNNKLKSETDSIYDNQTLSNIDVSKDVDFSIKNDKHNFQYNNLISIMKSKGIMEKFNSKSETKQSILEFGAGKGGFSHHLVNYLSLNENTINNVQFVLIDRQGVRNRFDAQHKTGPEFKRILMDIAHLDLAKVDYLENSSITVVSKHLCGVASDLTIRCLKNWLINKSDNSSYLNGLMIALCCHHKCTWDSYINKEWMMQLGIGPWEFYLMTLLSSWATCGVVKKFDDIMRESEHFQNIQSSEVGLLCKRIIDIGRKHYIDQEFEFKQVTIKPYIDNSVTLENCALFAYN